MFILATQADLSRKIFWRQQTEIRIMIKIKTEIDAKVLGRAALLRGPRIQGRAAALPCRNGEEFCPAPD